MIKKLSSDCCVYSGVSLPKDTSGAKRSSDKEILLRFETCIGASNISADPLTNAHYRSGWRSGQGAALAIVFPQTLISLWQVIKICVQENLIIIMQAANTGLTEGSTPSGEDYDRPVVVINTLAIDQLVLIREGEQVLSFPGTRLHKLEQTLAKINRAPHSVIGSSGLGASVIGGIANNSGGALVKRGPAYTEFSLFAQIDNAGRLQLVNHLGIDLGEQADEMILNLEKGHYDPEAFEDGERMASDKEYVDRIKQIDEDSPSRFNADPRRLYDASGCAGKLAVFAVRVDTHPIAREEKTVYLGSNHPHVLTQLRRRLLSELNSVPDIGEYMHRDTFNVAERYGKDTFLSVKYLGTKRLPRLFAAKGKIDALCKKYAFLPSTLIDKTLQFLSRLLPQHLPERLLAYRDRFEHHLIIKLSDDSIKPGLAIIHELTDACADSDYFVCSHEEAVAAYLNRFAAAGAALRYQLIHRQEVGEILALDIALKRNERDWFESLSEEVKQHIALPLYYGHFFCHVMHQDYVLKKEACADEVKRMMLDALDKRGAKYPAEHNVGHLYEADDTLQGFYQALDPCNVFNPGIGKQEKFRRVCKCEGLI